MEHEEGKPITAMRATFARPGQIHLEILPFYDVPRERARDDHPSQST